MKIKEIRQKVFEPLEIMEGLFIAGKLKEDYRDGFIKKFNQNGKITFQQTNHPSNNQITEYTYDQSGNLIVENVYCNEPRRLYRQQLYLYNEFNLLIRIKDTICEERGGDPSYTNYEYDKEGRVIKTAHYPFSKFLYCESFEYNETGSKQVLIQQNRNLEVTKYCEFQFNNKGLVIGENKQDRLSNSVVAWKTEYDDYDRRVEVMLFKDDIIYSRELFTYDDKGNLTSRKRVIEDSEEVISDEVFIFEYNERGDWTSRVYYHEGEIQSIIERKVTYY